MKALCVALLLTFPLAAREPLAQRIGHSDPTKYQVQKALHGGPGQFNGMFILDSRAVTPNLQFVHRAIMQPKSGVGAPFHNTCEEMFFIFDGEAEYTIDGRTALVKAPAGVLCRAGHSHAIYNPTDKPVDWMGINVALMKGSTDAFNLNDPRQGVPLDPIPQFMVTRFDRALLRPVEAMSGGKGTVQYRRAADPSIFTTPWAYIDQVLLAPGASIGRHMHRELAEVYFVMNGQGSVTLSAQGSSPETAAIGKGDAVPIDLSDIHSFENTGSEPLEMLVVGVSRDATKRIDSIDVGQMGGRRGN